MGCNTLLYSLLFRCTTTARRNQRVLFSTVKGLHAISTCMQILAFPDSRAGKIPTTQDTTCFDITIEWRRALLLPWATVRHGKSKQRIIYQLIHHLLFKHRRFNYFVVNLLMMRSRLLIHAFIWPAREYNWFTIYISPTAHVLSLSVTWIRSNQLSTTTEYFGSAFARIFVPLPCYNRCRATYIIHIALLFVYV